MNKITKNVKFAEIKGHIANMYDYSRRLLNPPESVIFLEWAEHQTFVNDAPYNFKYGIFVDMLGNHYSVLPKDINFTEEFAVNDEDELVPLSIV